MKKLALVGAMVLVGLTGCSDTVTRKTSTYQQTSANVPAGTVVAPGTVTGEDTTATKTTTTRKVEKYDTN